MSTSRRYVRKRAFIDGLTRAEGFASPRDLPDSDLPDVIVDDWLLAGNSDGTAIEYIDPTTVGSTTFAALTDTPSAPMTADKWLKLDGTGANLVETDAPFTAASDIPLTQDYLLQGNVSDQAVGVNFTGVSNSWAGVQTFSNSIILPTVTDTWIPRSDSGTVVGSERFRIGTDASGNKLALGLESGTTPRGLFDARGHDENRVTVAFTTHSTVAAAHGTLFKLARTRGDQETPAALDDTDQMGRLVFAGSYEASDALKNGTLIDSVTTEDWTATTTGAEMRFYTTATGTTGIAKAMTLTEAANVDVENDLIVGEDLAHEGSYLGFFGTTPVVVGGAFTLNATAVLDHTLLASASATTLNNNNVLAALIFDLQRFGIIP